MSANHHETPLSDELSQIIRFDESSVDATVLQDLLLRDSPIGVVEDSITDNRARHQESLKRKLQTRSDVNDLILRNIIPATCTLHSEQKAKLERAKAGDMLNRHFQLRPDRQFLIQHNILPESSVGPRVGDKQRALKKRCLSDNLEEKLSHRPGALELVQKNILPGVEPLQYALNSGLITFVKSASDFNEVNRATAIIDSCFQSSSTSPHPQAAVAPSPSSATGVPITANNSKALDQLSALSVTSRKKQRNKNPPLKFHEYRGPAKRSKSKTPPPVLPPQSLMPPPPLPQPAPSNIPPQNAFIMQPLSAQPPIIDQTSQGSVSAKQQPLYRYRLTTTAAPASATTTAPNSNDLCEKRQQVDEYQRQIKEQQSQIVKQKQIIDTLQQQIVKDEIGAFTRVTAAAASATPKPARIGSGSIETIIQQHDLYLQYSDPTLIQLRQSLVMLTSPQLKEKCRDLGLKVSGRKAKLVDRLVHHMVNARSNAVAVEQQQLQAFSPPTATSPCSSSSSSESGDAGLYEIIHQQEQLIRDLQKQLRRTNSLLPGSNESCLSTATMSFDDSTFLQPSTTPDLLSSHRIDSVAASSTTCINQPDIIQRAKTTGSDSFGLPILDFEDDSVNPFSEMFTQSPVEMMVTSPAAAQHQVFATSSSNDNDYSWPCGDLL